MNQNPTYQIKNQGLEKVQAEPQQQVRQQSYYYSLKKYEPIWYSGKGAPIFLLLKKDYLGSLPCVAFINIITIALIILQLLSPKNGSDGDEMKVITKINILVLIFIDIFYILTITLNPGVISEYHMEINQNQNASFCLRCKRKINDQMKHCIQCEVCVEDLDHHCGFFGKCIAGRQRFAFYGFITFMFIGFVSLLGGMAMFLGPN